MEQGLIHLYYGDGKGKTTAATGLAVRGAGAGKQVIFSQFMKGNDSSEIGILRSITGITVLKVGKAFGFYQTMDDKERQEITEHHNRILQKIRQLQKEGRTPDLLIMDEITYAYRYHLLDRKLLEKIIRDHEGMEIVMTGRNPESFLLESADYITEMKCVSHPYGRGIAARHGIEF